jgi:hypothetical protein
MQDVMEKDKTKNELHPLCGAAGERVGQRSVAGVSRDRRSKPPLLPMLNALEKAVC